MEGPEELERATEKFERRQEHIAKSEGFGATEFAQAITRKWIPELASGLKRVLSHRKTQSPVHRELLAVLRDLDPEVLALCILQGALHSMGQGKSSYRDAALRVGKDIGAECWAAGLTRRAPNLSARIEKQVKQRFSSSKARRDAARAAAARAGYKTKEWDNERRLQAGNWALTVLLDLLPDVFIVASQGQERLLTITEGAQAYADGVVDEVIARNPLWLPRPEAPRPWMGWDEGGTNDKRLQVSLTLVRSKYKQKTATAIRRAIRDGSMRPAIDALNALQAVPWTINKRVLGVIRECADYGLEVPGLPQHEIATLDKHSWNELTSDERALRKLAHQALGARVLFREDMRTGERMCQSERFYTAMNLEWRGRVYCVPSFNFQREDRVRALFLFAEGEPIGEEGIYWLKVHVANCGDFDRISKRPFGDRVKWVDDNLELICSTAESPVPMFRKWVEQTAKHPEHKWQGPEKPFLFLSACMELAPALGAGPSYVAQLPVSFDGSCSGLQHLCAMMRAPEGSLVNLTPQEVPADVYQSVADRVRQRIEGDLENEDRRQREVAQMCLEYGVTRKIVKRNVMTYSYGSKVYGMTEQLREDLMQPLSKEVQLGKLEEHPFANDGYWASKYLARQTFRAIEEVINGPAEAKTFLQKLARALSHEGKHLRWKTPVGIPWINRYQKVDTKQVKLWLHDRGVRVPYTIKLAIGDQAEIDKNGAANGVAPNFVHALDAAHLLRTVNAAVAEGITSIATVHDSFGCLPSRAARFRRLIREEFVRMYNEHDVLAEVYEQARANLSNPDTKRMPSGPPQKGSLEIGQLLDAEFAFA